MIGTLWPIRPSFLEFFDQPDPTEKFDQNRQAAKGRHCPQGVAEFDLSPTKKRLKFLPIVLFRRLRRIFDHNLFSHNRLEQNESLLHRANFGF
jgi:hypothetical protein